MPSFKYQDFVLGVELDEHSDYWVRILRAPQGSGDGRLQLPYSLEEVPAVIRCVERTARSSFSSIGTENARDLRPAKSQSDKLISPEMVGGILFEALFRDSVRDCFLMCLESVQRQPWTGLRVHLVMNPSSPKVAPLCALPWELMYRVETREFLGRNPLTPIVRHLGASQSANALPQEGELRILIAFSCPNGQEALNLDKELAHIIAAWGHGSAVKLVTLQHATLERVREALRSAQFHVFHFMGHGEFDEHSGEGMLLFERPNGDPDPISGRVLVDFLRDHRTLQLILLNACETARFPRWQGQDPYAGVASALVMAGYPAVLAMQFPIADSSAIEFSNVLYAAIATGEPVDAAVVEARLATYKQAPKGIGWAAPVLFTGTTELRIVAPLPSVDLAGGESHERSEAARRLGESRNPQAVPILDQRWVDEMDPTVRYWLAVAMGTIGGRHAVEVLLRLKDNESDQQALKGIDAALTRTNAPDHPSGKSQ